MRSGLKWALAAGILVPVPIWIGAWYVGAQRVDAAIDNWLIEEKARDRLWACGQRTTSGFPFQLHVECSSPSFRSTAGPIRNASAQSVSAWASVLSPARISMKVEGPLKLSGQDFTAILEWKDLRSEIGKGAQLPELSLQSSDVRTTDATGVAQGWRGASASEIAFRTRSAPDRDLQARAAEVSVSAVALKSGVIDAYVGNDAPLNATLSAIVLNVASEPTGAFADRVEHWRTGGGRVQLTSLAIRKGSSTIDANGNLALDERRRPEGRLSLRVSGVQAILSGLNVPSAPLAIEGLLRGSARSGGGSLLENRALPIELRNGRVYLGPVRTPIMLPPLY
jgi:hypothetical protein